MINLGWVGSTGNMKVILEEKFGDSYYEVETFTSGLVLSDFTSGKIQTVALATVANTSPASTSTYKVGITGFHFVPKTSYRVKVFFPRGLCLQRGACTVTESSGLLDTSLSYCFINENIVTITQLGLALPGFTD